MVKQFRQLINQHYGSVIFVVFIAVLTTLFAVLSAVLGAGAWGWDRLTFNEEEQIAPNLFDSVALAAEDQGVGEVLGVQSQEAENIPEVSEEQVDGQTPSNSESLSNGESVGIENSASSSPVEGSKALQPTPLPFVAAAIPEKEQNEIVYLTIRMPSGVDAFSVYVAENSTVADVMQQAVVDNKITMTTKTFGSMGLFVESINGIEVGEGFWMYSVNGVFADKGISQKKVQQGDSIVWTYE